MVFEWVNIIIKRRLLKKINIKNQIMLNFMNYTIAIYKVDIPVTITLFPWPSKKIYSHLIYEYDNQVLTVKNENTLFFYRSEFWNELLNNT